MKITRGVRLLGTTFVLALLATPLLVTAAAPAGAGNDAAQAGPLRQIGTLPEPAGTVRAQAGTIAAVDAVHRRMYYVYTDKQAFDHVVTYDLTPRIPKAIATGPLAADANILLKSPYSVALDTKRRQLTFITGNIDANGKTVVLGNPTMTSYSDVTHKVSGRWALSQTLPGFFPFGLTYSEKDDRIYVLGEFSGLNYAAASTFTFGSKAAGAVTAVAALNPADGKLLWMRPVSECQQGLFTLGVGGLIARATAQDALYFACVTGGTANGKTYPGQAGLVRLNIDPKTTDSAAAAQRPVEFFAVSGNYFNGAATGIAAFDRQTDRFYLQSLARQTPGDWVFDGRLSAWVGFVSAPSPADRYIGLNEGLGHLYIGTYQGANPPPVTDGILTADVRQTPVPAGEFQPIVPGGFIATDAGSNRLFVLPYDAATTLKPYLILEDTMPVTHGEVPVDYDADTTDTADLPTNEVSYALGAAGFGAETIQVGGTAGATSGVEPPGAPQPPPPAPGIPVVAGGTRAVMSARLGGLDLRAGGAAASTQAALSDINTVQYYEGQNGPWPYPVTSCLDSVGTAATDSYQDRGNTGPANGGTSSVTCDLGKATAVATARMGASGAGGTTVHKSAYDATATRTVADGATVTTTASAEGVTFDVTGGINVRLGRVVATSKSVAHGRPGTTSASWERVVHGFLITNATGTPLVNSPGCSSKVEVGGGTRKVEDTCADLAAQLNKVLPTRFRISFPMPNVIATPKGAYAAVEQTDADYFQQRVVNDQGVIYRGDSIGPRPVPAVVTEAYNDSTERSRTVTVLAATQSSAIFTVVPPFSYGPDGGDGTGTGGGTPGTAGTPGTPGSPGVVSGTTGGAGGTAPPPQTTGNGGTAAAGTRLQGYLFMRRSLRDAALLVLFAGLLLGGAATAWRRRRLVEVLLTVPRKEA
jgi:hypothetical protein